MYTAVIVEPRQHAALGFVLTNFMSNLSEDWNFLIFHGTHNLDHIQKILQGDIFFAPFLSRISLVSLPFKNLSIHQYNRLLTSTSFYNAIPTETILIFQTDTMIFPKHRDLIDDFLKYDYVGAPWKDGSVGNGGLSLRKKSKMLEILATCPYDGFQNEDCYFSNNKKVSLYKPSGEEAKRFSIESVFNDVAFGTHSGWRWFPDFFFDTYPEAKAISELQFSHSSYTLEDL